MNKLYFSKVEVFYIYLLEKILQYIIIKMVEQKNIIKNYNSFKNAKEVFCKCSYW